MNKIIPFLILILGIIFFIAREALMKSRLKKDTRYTIGVLRKINSASNGGPIGEFEYKVYGKVYNKIFDISESDNVNVNDTFIIKFNLFDPNICYPMIERKVKGFHFIPDSGWSTPIVTSDRMKDTH